MNPFRIATAVLLALAAAIALVPFSATAATGTVVRSAGESPAAIRDYWTKSRMRHAEPVPVEPVTRSAAGAASPAEGGHPTYVAPASPGQPAAAGLERGSASGNGRKSGLATPVPNPAATKVRAHGKVYFTVKGGSYPGNFVCSATAVNSPNRSLVWTAGHCVYDAEHDGGKSINFAFAPAHGTAGDPYGIWPAKKLGTTKGWKRDGNLRYDVGAVVVARNDGRRLQAVVGARGIGFDQGRKHHYDIFGYPALAPFDGEIPYTCSGPNSGSDSPGGSGPKTIRSRCDMTAGSSGGGWIVKKTLLSVTSYGYGGQPDYLYGPYLSQTAKKLYKRMRR